MARHEYAPDWLGDLPPLAGHVFFDTAETLGTDRHLGPHSVPRLTLRPQRDSAT